MLLDQAKAIQFSYQLLDESKYAEPYPYHGASYAQVKFPSGKKGIFIAIGFVGTVHGYQFLYKFEEDKATLLDFKQAQVDWGVYSLESEIPTPTPIEVVNLFADNQNENFGTVIKVIGAKHDGTGLFANGAFEIIHITDQGLSLLFSDLEENRIIGSPDSSFHETYKFSFEDVNGDNTRELIKEGEKCKIVTGNDGNYRDTDCETGHIIFEYVEGSYRAISHKSISP